MSLIWEQLFNRSGLNINQTGPDRALYTMESNSWYSLDKSGTTRLGLAPECFRADSVVHRGQSASWVSSLWKNINNVRLAIFKQPRGSFEYFLFRISARHVPTATVKNTIKIETIIVELTKNDTENRTTELRLVYNGLIEYGKTSFSDIETNNNTKFLTKATRRR